jgi:hypothetical protein
MHNQLSVTCIFGYLHIEYPQAHIVRMVTEAAVLSALMKHVVWFIFGMFSFKIFTRISKVLHKVFSCANLKKRCLTTFRSVWKVERRHCVWEPSSSWTVGLYLTTRVKCRTGDENNEVINPRTFGSPVQLLVCTCYGLFRHDIMRSSNSLVKLVFGF